MKSGSTSRRTTRTRQTNAFAPSFRDSPTLASMPLMDRERPELSPGLRSFVVGHHVIFYLLFDGGVEVVRMLDGVRDLPPLFE